MEYKTRKQAATIMKQTFNQHKHWWASSKNEKMSRVFEEARKIYKESK